jgi:ABC-type antimicrobial peptide transport system permease subunit
MVVKNVSLLLMCGAAVGLLITLLVRKVIGVVIYLDAGKEANLLLGTALVLVGAGLMAALLPARRAASIEPVEALRAE